jgi:hypothetical protein
MGWLNKVFETRWSLYIVDGKRLAYVMHCDRVMFIIGLVMDYYNNGGKPRPPWSLQLHFNKGRESFELKPEHFIAGRMSTALSDKIERIDPGYSCRAKIEPKCVDLAIGQKMKFEDDSFTPEGFMRDILDPKALKQLTFVRALHNIFH